MSLLGTDYTTADFGVVTERHSPPSQICRHCTDGRNYDGSRCLHCEGTGLVDQLTGRSGPASSDPERRMAYWYGRKLDPHVGQTDENNDVLPVQERARRDFERRNLAYDQAEAELRAQEFKPVSDPAAVGAGMYRHGVRRWAN